MHLSALSIKNFRLLQDFHAPNLGQVNLLVGKNNCGKSSVLEALRIYAANADGMTLIDAARRHDEDYIRRKALEEAANNSRPFSAFFHGRQYPQQDGIRIEIGDPEQNMLQIEHVFLQEQETSIIDADGERRLRTERVRIKKNTLSAPNMGSALEDALQITKGGQTSTISLGKGGSVHRLLDNKFPCGFVSSQLEAVGALADDWDKIALTPAEQAITDALRLILPELQGLAFVRAGRYEPPDGWTERSAVVKLQNHPDPVPFRSLGEGMLRLLQIMLKVFAARNGFLLIDEFENGLHYSVQEDVWRVLFKLAAQHNIQIFATTHSQDCIYRFAQVAVQEKEVSGKLMRIGISQRDSDRGRTIATVYEEDELLELTRAGYEVR